MRSSTYSEETAEAICARMAEGESLRAICRDEAMPSYRTAFNWIATNKDFRQRYELAMQIRSQAIFEDLLDIADDGRNDWMEKRSSVGQLIGWAENGEAARRSAIRIDARKWVLARMAPKKYGERLDLSHSGGVMVENEPDLSGLSKDEIAVLKELHLKARRTAAKVQESVER